LRRIPAIVAFRNPQPALSLVGGNRSSCPEADFRVSTRDRGIALETDEDAGRPDVKLHATTAGPRLKSWWRQLIGSNAYPAGQARFSVAKDTRERDPDLRATGNPANVALNPVKFRIE